MHIVQINYQDMLGGAEYVALTLHHRLQQQGHNANLYVGKKSIEDETIQDIDPDKDNDVLTQVLINQALKLEGVKKNLLTHYGSKLFRAIARPCAFARWFRGEEEFNFKKTKNIITEDKHLPDLFHLHNLHGNYFNLKLLPTFCNKRPVNLTLHDEWMYTGHCGYSSNCNRWQTGCGECPDLEAYPAIRVDNTRHNLKVKKNIYQQTIFNTKLPF